MKPTLVAIILLVCCASFYWSPQKGKNKREYYQVTIYHFKNQEQKQEIDSFFNDAWLPALHKMGINNIGVFIPIANDTVIDKKVIVIMPAQSMEDITDLPSKLLKDESFQLAGKKFIDAPYNNPPFSRMEKIVLYAFPKAPFLQLPKLTSAKSERVYELRSYESPTEKLFRNKVQMFNEGGEVGLFKRLNFNAVFYAEVIAGSSMPNLMYMTSFENMADRDAHWKTFGADPEWKKLSGDPIYQHNVSKADIILMKAADYSDY
jgi:hypothetical protein